MKKRKWKGLLVFLMLGALIFACALKGTGETVQQLSYPEFWQLAEQGQIAAVVMQDSPEWRITLQSGQTVQTPNPRSETAKERLLALEIDVQESAADPLPGWALGGIVVFAAVLLRKRKSGHGAAGLARYAAVQADCTIPSTTFSDVVAAPETLHSMKDLVAFLQSPDQFTKMGARPPKGVLLYGPPGTGKTLLARALAGEAHTPFFAMSGADFVQVYVGVGASRVRELFRKARKDGGGVIFIDEIDAIGKKRDNGNDEREQTLNALLTEMSGFSGADGIIVLAATNRIDTLDPALLREGRFDRRIEIGLPNYAQRLQILKVHARKKPLSPQVDLTDLARQTILFSGAQLETLLNEAAIRAARRNSTALEPADLEQAYLAVTVGEDSMRPLSPEEKRITAFHEAGHALITHCMLPASQLTRVTILPSSRGAAGYSMSIPPDRVLHTRSELKAMLCAALAGRCAEELVFGAESVTTGASNDLQKAREIAKAMAEEFGMGETGDVAVDIKALLRQGREETLACLNKEKERLMRLAQALLTHETLRSPQLQEILASD